MHLSDLARRYLLYGLSGPVIVLNLWVLQNLFLYFQGIITFVVLAAILALILNYLVNFLRQFRLNRTQSVLVVLVAFLTVIITLGFTLIPVIISQANQLFQGLVNLLKDNNQNLSSLQSLIINSPLPFDLNQITNQIIAQLQGVLGFLPELAVNTAGQFFSTIFLIVLAFYMLLYGDRCWRGLISFLPERFGKALSRSLQQQLHQFFLSQFLLALVMSLSLAIVFLLMGIHFALLFALIVGLFQIIPLFGATIGIGLVTFLAWGLQGSFPAIQVVVVSLIFQQITDNIIAPRIRGNFSGLNPIWIIVALLIGWRVAGFIGVVLAMPIGGTIKTTIETMRELEH